MPTPYHASLRPSRAISRHLAPSRARCTGCFGRSTRWRGRRGKPPTARAERPRRPTGRWPTRWSAPTRSSTSSPWSASSRRIRRPLPRSARPHDVTSHEGRPVWRCFSPLIEFLVDCSFFCGVPYTRYGNGSAIWVETADRITCARPACRANEPRDTSGRAAAGICDLSSAARTCAAQCHAQAMARCAP